MASRETKSLWDLLTAPDDRAALDEAMRANRELQQLRAQVELQGIRTRAAVAEVEAATVDAQITAMLPSARELELERKLLAVSLYARTLLALMVDKGVVTVEEFQEKFREFDLLDGKLDER